MGGVGNVGEMPGSPRARTAHRKPFSVRHSALTLKWSGRNAISVLMGGCRGNKPMIGNTSTGKLTDAQHLYQSLLHIVIMTHTHSLYAP
jgi:hypothetical protein